MNSLSRYSIDSGGAIPPREEKTTGRKWRPRVMQPFRCFAFFSAVRAVKSASEDMAAAFV